MTATGSITASVGTSATPDEIDLRDGEAVPWPTAAPPVVVATDKTALRRRRLVVVAVLLGLVGLGAADFVVGRVVHDQHQRHLAAVIAVHASSTRVGDPVMILQIPSIGFNQVVVDGTDAAQLRGGPGLAPSGALPGRRGTTVVVAHRYRYGGPFADLHNVKPGETAAAQLRDGVVKTYKVISVRHLTGVHGSAIPPSTAERLVLVTSGEGLWPGGRLEVILKPDVPATVGRAPGSPVRLAGGSSGIALVLLLALLVASGAAVAYGTKRLRRDYRPGTVLTVLTPIVGLLIVVLVLSLDLALPALY